MTTPAAVVGLIYDGSDCQNSTLTVFLEIARGLNETPAVRGEDVIVAAAAGRSERVRVNDVLPIELAGIVTADPSLAGDAALASYRTNMAGVRALFASNRARADLEAVLEGGAVLSISARPMPGIVVTEHRDHAHLSIPMEGYDDWVEAS